MKSDVGEEIERPSRCYQDVQFQHGVQKLLVFSPLQGHFWQLWLAVHEDTQVDVYQLLYNLQEARRERCYTEQKQTMLEINQLDIQAWWITNSKDKDKDSQITYQKKRSKFLSFSGYWIYHGNNIKIYISLFGTNLHSTANKQQINEKIKQTKHI